MHGDLLWKPSWRIASLGIGGTGLARFQGITSGLFISSPATCSSRSSSPSALHFLTSIAFASSSSSCWFFISSSSTLSWRMSIRSSWRITDSRIEPRACLALRNASVLRDRLSVIWVMSRSCRIVSFCVGWLQKLYLPVARRPFLRLLLA